MPRRRWVRYGAGWAALVVIMAVPVAGALACGPAAPAPLGALPATGALDVPPSSSIVVIGGSDGPPQGLLLEAGGMQVPLPLPRTIGSGLASGQPATFYRLTGPLTPSTLYVLRSYEPGSMAIRELTRFTTGATTDKPVGTPARLERLRLWRVRYPLAAIGAGGCVFDEYHGYIDLTYQDGIVPGTPPAEVVSRLALVPENGTAAQSFVFTGGPFSGHTTVIPEGGLPEPQNATWRPELAPDRRYCLTLSQEGRNDLAQLPVRSNTLCAPVVNVDLTGGVTDAGADGAGDGGVGDGAIGDLSASDARPGAPTDAQQIGGGVIERASRGCATGGVGGEGGWSLPAVMIGALLTVWRGRRRTGRSRRPPP